MKTALADVRHAVAGDAPALSAVHAAAWREAYAGLIPYRSLDEMIRRRGVDWWQRAIGSGVAVLALQHGDEIAGYATVGRNRAPVLGVPGEIYELYLRPHYQGVGLGRHLFEAARSLLRTRAGSGVAAWALEDNTRAMDFYRALGGEDIACGSETFDGKTMGKVAFVWR